MSLPANAVSKFHERQFRNAKLSANVSVFKVEFPFQITLRLYYSFDKAQTETEWRFSIFQVFHAIYSV